MNLYEFNALELNERMGTANQYGTYLYNYIGYGERCNCYAIDKFFVKVLQDAKHNTIIGIRSFKSGHGFDKYSDKF